MPRGEVQLKLIDDPKKRRSTYLKRIRGLKQKTYELSTLCGVDAFMASYGPSGEAETWPENHQEIQDAVARYRKEIKKSSITDVPTMEALVELRLGRVRERIQLLWKQRGLEEGIFSWMDCGEEEGVACDEIIPCPDASNFLLPTDTGFPPELFLNGSTDGGGVQEPYVELANYLFSLLPPTDDAGFLQLPPEPCFDISCYSQVASDHDRFFIPLGLNDLQSRSPFDSYWTCTPEDCLDGYGHGHDSGLLGHSSSELFDDTGFGAPVNSRKTIGRFCIYGRLCEGQHRSLL